MTTKNHDNVRRGRYARSKGIRYERKIANLFRDAGFHCERVLEYDGLHTGCDLLIGRIGPDHDETHEEYKIRILPVAIQVKNTATPVESAEAGHEQAKKGWPTAEVHACVHNDDHKPKVLWSVTGEPWREWCPFSLFIHSMKTRYGI